MMTCWEKVCCCLVLTLVTASGLQAQEVSWMTDYTQARKVARGKGLPILLDFGTESCFWCKKLDETTFRDPAVCKLLGSQFITVKIDGDKYIPLVKALEIESYPTLIFAGSDGKILARHSGYIKAPELLEKLRRFATQTVRRDTASEQVIQPVAGSAFNPTQVKPIPTTPGPDSALKDRDSGHATRLLEQAKSAYRDQRDLSCLESCKELLSRYPAGSEASEARRLLTEMHSDPERIQQVAESLTTCLGDLYLDRGETLLRENQTQQAMIYFQRAARLSPSSRCARVAEDRLRSIEAGLVGKTESMK